MLRNLQLNELFIYLVLILICLIFIFSSLNHSPEKLKNIELKNKSIKLKDCIDIENKNRRSSFENIELTEFCLNEFRSKKID